MKINSLLKKLSPVMNYDCYPDAVIIIDDSSNIVEWNAKAQELFGYSREEMIGRDIEILFDSGIEKIFESVDCKKVIILSARNSFEENMFVEASCMRLSGQDRTIITARDVTKNQQVIKKLLVEYETAIKINNNKNRFISSLSGDLKTPIHSLIGFSQGLIDGVCGEMTEKQSRYVAIISKNANNLLELVDNILELSALEAGNADINLKVFDVIRTLNQVCSKVRIGAEKKGLQFETDFNDIVKRNIYSDENMLSRILINVLENAVKFTDIGSLRIKALHPDDDKSQILFQVTDTGIGLSDEDIRSLFDEYNLPDRNMARKYGGTGLKLALTRKMLSALGGEITVESEPGLGSTFYFSIPIERN